MSKRDIGEATERYDYDKKEYLPLVEGGILIADVDESESYETDQTRVYYFPTTGKAVWASASGCSCWDGTWGLVEYDSLDELLTDLGVHGSQDQVYSPSFKGVKDLVRQCNEWFTKTHHMKHMAGVDFDGV